VTCPFTFFREWWCHWTTGWGLAIANNRIIWGQCPVPCFETCSYHCTKGYDMLSSLLFLCHLCLYCMVHLNLIPLTSIHCDNLSLITKFNKLLTFQLAPTQAALHSEYDILATIHDMLKDLSQIPTISHIKDH
jgi:hypothetical protein